MGLIYFDLRLRLSIFLSPACSLYEKESDRSLEISGPVPSPPPFGFFLTIDMGGPDQSGIWDSPYHRKNNRCRVEVLRKYKHDAYFPCHAPFNTDPCDTRRLCLHEHIRQQLSRVFSFIGQTGSRFAHLNS